MGGGGSGGGCGGVGGGGGVDWVIRRLLLQDVLAGSWWNEEWRTDSKGFGFSYAELGYLYSVFIGHFDYFFVFRSKFGCF